MAKEPEYIEPEVLPPESGGRGRPYGPPPPRRGGEPWSPLRAGLLLDALDLLTFGPLGLRGGLLLGAVAAFLLLSKVGVPLRVRVPLAVAAGLYCAIPGTELLPLGTLLSLFIQRIPP